MAPLPHPDTVTTRDRIAEHARCAQAENWPETANPYHEGTDLHAVWRAEFCAASSQAGNELEPA